MIVMIGIYICKGGVHEKAMKVVCFSIALSKLGYTKITCYIMYFLFLSCCIELAHSSGKPWIAQER